MNKARLAEAGRGVFQKKNSASSVDDRVDIVCLVQAHNG